jgi:D-alanine-D-alanine ligase
VFAALDTKEYTPVLIGITKSGVWLDAVASKKLLDGEKVSQKGTLVPVLDRKAVDVVFPVLHGSFGEDGTMQGFLKLIDVPFVGPGVLGSAVGMDKDVAKRLLRDAGIGIAPFETIHRNERESVKYRALVKALGKTLFVKPANAGSSVGVSKTKNEAEFFAALDEAFRFDTKVLVEAAILGREIEVAVMGNEIPEASVAGEVMPAEAFYSYDAKYAATSQSVVEIPAKLTKVEMKTIREVAMYAYKVLGLEGMSRVDFFYTEDGMLLVNEVNTIPGFTSISMYPKMWEASGVPFTELLGRLIELAMARHATESALARSL